MNRATLRSESDGDGDLVADGVDGGAGEQDAPHG